MALPAKTFNFEKIYTSEEFEALPEFDERFELIDGRLVEKPMPNSEHLLIVHIIQRAIDRFDPDEQLGMALPEASVKLSPRNTPMPDLAFWIASRKPKRSKSATERPDLAIEILSPHDVETKKRFREVQDKIRKYQIAGVKIIWVVNPQNKTVEVYHPDQIEPVQVLGIGEQLDGEKVIPNFTLPVAALFD